jgi:hypothetical protein
VGAYDSLIGVPIPGQPISSGAYGVPVRNAILDLDTRLAIIEASQQLPASVFVAATGANPITWGAGTWQDLTASPATVEFTNPSTAFDLVLNVYFGCWASALSGAQARMGLKLTGGVSVPTPGAGLANQPAGWGLFPVTTQATLDQHMGLMQVIIPAGAAAVTFTAQGYRSAAQTTTVDYPTIHVVPERYQLP